LASTRQWYKHINYLAIIFIVFIIVSCSDSNENFNLILKSFSDNNDEATISFKNLSSNKVIEKTIRTMNDLNINLDLDSEYTIEYKNLKSNIFGYIKKIKPIEYNNKEVFLTLNENENFRSLLYTINDSIEDGKIYYYLYSNNYIYRAMGNSFKKLSLINLKDENINKPFSITDNKVISLDGVFLINESEISFINEEDELKFTSHNITNLEFSVVKHIKRNSDYFFIFKKNDNNYNCVNLTKQKNDIIKINEANDCITIAISDNSQVLMKDNEFYLWDSDKLYKYENSKFSLYHQFTNTGTAFHNNNNIYMISDTDNLIYLVDIKNKKLIKLNTNQIITYDVHTFDINETTTLITSSYWSTNDKYYIFDTINSQISLKEYEFNDDINLKYLTNIKIDKNQNIFFNISSFEVSNQKFNSIKFYLFSYFK